MINEESKRVKNLSEWYLKEQLDFDKRLIRFRYQTLKPFLKGPEGLELGPAEGHMTQFLLHDFARLTVVDAATELLECIPNDENLVKINSLFEEYQPDHHFDTIVMEHILEHVEKPIELLQRVKDWLRPPPAFGKLLIGVPNGHSFHRLAAVKMGLLKDPCELNSRDLELGHRRVYTPAMLEKDLKSSGLKIITTGGVFFKPLSNRQIQDHWNEEMIQGFYELGKDFPENAAGLYAVCELP
ncbi:MAG: class I SAM-dependent methyltransferase [Desulfosalsimonadaceae bacterium]